MGVKSVNALVERYEAARRAATSSNGAAGSHEAPEVVEGSVQELIDLYNGMARSLPDFPRSAYSRSTRRRPAPLAPAQPPTVVNEEEQHDTLERAEIDDEDGEEEGEEEVEPQDLEHECTEKDEDERGDGSEEEDELSTCDETASINSLSSSFMSDCSYDDHGSEASLYYESEYQAYQQAAETEPEPEEEDEDDEHQPGEPTTEPTCDSLPLEPEAELVAILPSVIAVEIAQPPTAESCDSPCEKPEPEPANRLPSTTPGTETEMSKHEQTESLPKKPRALLPSRIPIRRGSTIYAVNKKAIKSVPATVSGGSERVHPSGASISRPVAVQPQRERCDPSVPRSPMKKDVCSRFAAANSPSPHKQEETKRSERRRSISNFNKPKTPVPTESPAQAAPTTMAMKKKRASITASSARFQVSKAPTSSFVDTTIATVQSAPTKFTPISRNSTPISNTRATRSHSAPTRPREIQARAPTPPLSAPLPASQNAEISLDRVKSRLFDYENDPKRLEMVAANRARRKSLETRTLQAVYAREVVKRTEMSSQDSTKKRKLKTKMKRTSKRKRTRLPPRRSPQFPSDTEASDQSQSESDSAQITQVTTTRCIREELYLSTSANAPQDKPKHELSTSDTDTDSEAHNLENTESQQSHGEHECPSAEAVAASIGTLSAFLRFSQLHIPDRLHLMIQLREMELLVERSAGSDTDSDSDSDGE